MEPGRKMEFQAWELCTWSVRLLALWLSRSLKGCLGTLWFLVSRLRVGAE